MPRTFEEELTYLNAWLGAPENEGTRKKAYLPVNSREDAKDSKSGITIAKGFDLGQVDEEFLLNAPITPRLYKVLRPLVGLKGVKAWDKFQELKASGDIPEIQDEDQLSALTNYVQEPKLKDLIKKIGPDRWYNLPDGAKKVAYAAATQYGDRFYKQDAYKQIKSGKFEDLRKNLMNWGDKTKGTAKSINDRYARYADLSFVQEADIESELKESIRAQLEARGEQVDADLQPITNTSQNGSQELTGGLTAEEEAEWRALSAELQSYGLQTPKAEEEPTWTEEDEAEYLALSDELSVKPLPMDKDAEIHAALQNKLRPYQELDDAIAREDAKVAENGGVL